MGRVWAMGPDPSAFAPSSGGLSGRVGPLPPPRSFVYGPGGFLWISAIRRAAWALIFHVIFSFVTITGIYFMLLMWTVHVGSCMWYYLVRTEDPTIELAWSFEQRATLVRINPDAPRFAPSASPFTAGEDEDDGRVQVRCGTVLGTLGGVAQRR